MLVVPGYPPHATGPGGLSGVVSNPAAVAKPGAEQGAFSGPQDASVGTRGRLRGVPERTGGVRRAWTEPRACSPLYT